MKKVQKDLKKTSFLLYKKVFIEKYSVKSASKLLGTKLYLARKIIENFIRKKRLIKRYVKRQNLERGVCEMNSFSDIVQVKENKKDSSFMNIMNENCFINYKIIFLCYQILFYIKFNEICINNKVLNSLSLLNEMRNLNNLHI